MKIRVQTEFGNTLSESEADVFPITLGRAKSNTIVVNISEVSSKHVELSWDGQFLTVKDLGSSNGTFVDGMKITTKKIAVPCSFTLGRNTFVEVEAEQKTKFVADLPELEFNPRSAAAPSLALKTADSPARAIVPVPVIASLAADAPLVAIKPAPRWITKASLKPNILPAPVRTYVKAQIWESAWDWLQAITPRFYAFAMCALALVYALFDFIVFRESILGSLANGFLYMAGSCLLGLLSAAILAMPGILIRGSYNLKPMYIVYSFSCLLSALHALVLMPAAALLHYFSYIAILFSLVFLSIIAVTNSYIFLFTTFPHRWGKKLALLTIVFAISGLGFSAKQTLQPNQQEVMRNVLLGTVNRSAV